MGISLPPRPKTAISSIRQAKHAIELRPEQSFLAVGIETCQREHLLRVEEIVARFPVKALCDMCAAHPEFARLLLADYNLHPPSTSNGDGLAAAMASLSLENGDLNPCEVAEQLSAVMWARYGDPERLWALLRKVGWWRIRRHDARFPGARSVTQSPLQELLRTKVVHADFLVQLIPPESVAQRRVEHLPTLVTLVVPLDQLYESAIRPYAKQFGWEDDNPFFTDEIVTSPHGKCLTG